MFHRRVSSSDNSLEASLGEWSAIANLFSYCFHLVVNLKFICVLFTCLLLMDIGEFSMRDCSEFVRLSRRGYNLIMFQ